MRHPLGLKATLWQADGRAPGFTLIEMTIAALVTSVLLLAVYTSYDVQQKAYTVQRELSRMESGMRAAMYLIKSDIRNAGRSAAMDGTVGGVEIIQESRRWDPINPAAYDAGGFQGITLTTARDTDNDSIGDYTDPAARIVTTYRIMDQNGDGRRELRRTQDGGANWQLVADGIDNMAFAFAYDANNDEVLDRNPGGVNIIWAIDDDATIGLDTNLDNNDSGTITTTLTGEGTDDGDGDKWIGIVDGPLPASISMRKIRAVRIWLLARSARTYRKYQDNHTYQVGHRVFKPTTEPNINGAFYQADTGKYRWAVLESSVHLRNRERLDIN